MNKIYRQYCTATGGVVRMAHPALMKNKTYVGCAMRTESTKLIAKKIIFLQKKGASNKPPLSNFSF